MKSLLCLLCGMLLAAVLRLPSLRPFAAAVACDLYIKLCSTTIRHPPTHQIRLDNTGAVELGWVDSGAAAGWHLQRVNDVSHLLTEGVAF